MASSFATGLAEGVTSGLTGMPSGSSSKSSGKDWKRKQKMSNSKAPAESGTRSSGADEMGSYKRGGKVRKTGRAKVHKGERVLTAKQAKRYEKRGRKRG